MDLWPPYHFVQQFCNINKAYYVSGKSATWRNAAGKNILHFKIMDNHEMKQLQIYKQRKFWEYQNLYCNETKAPPSWLLLWIVASLLEEKFH